MDYNANDARRFSTRGQIIIPGNPIAKKRPKFARRGKFVSTYNPQETEEGRWMVIAAQQINHGLITGAISIEFRFEVSRPKSHYGTGKNAGKLKPSAPKYCTKKPDFDNCVKFACDCLNNLLYQDDAQIVRCSELKTWADGLPRTVIKYEALEE